MSLCRTTAGSGGVGLDYLRRTIAAMEGEGGNITDAVRILNELRGEKVQQVRKDDPAVLAIDFRLRYWAAVEQAHTGQTFNAAENLRRLSEDIAATFGVTSELRGKALRELRRITSPDV